MIQNECVERKTKKMSRAYVSENPPISRQNNPHLRVVLADFAETTLAPVKVELCNANIISLKLRTCVLVVTTSFTRL